MIDTINRIMHTLDRLSGHSSIAQGGVITMAFLSSFFVPLVPVVLTCFGVSLIDLYYGLKVGKMNKRIESRRAWEGTLRKGKDILVILTAARGVELYVLCGIAGTALVGGFATIVALTEMWSVLENLNTLNPKGPWRLLGRFMKKKGQDITGLDLNELKNEPTERKKVAKKIG